MEYKINDVEREGLYGLPYLQQLLYLRGIRPYMDFHNGMVGVKRRISYQSFSEELYIEAHPGYQSGSPSKSQIRRALRGLERAGVIQLRSEAKRLLIECLLATQDYCVQNKGVTKPSHQAISLETQKINGQSVDYPPFTAKGIRAEIAKGGTPPEDNNYFYFLSENFEIFWECYPIKKSKQKAWEAFQALRPSSEAFQTVLSGLERQRIFYQEQQAKGHWLPNWKYPANWLIQRCWEDELTEMTTREVSHDRKKQTDEFWEACKGGDYDEGGDTSKVIQLSDYQDACQSD